MKRSVRTLIIVLLAAFLATPALAEEGADPKSYPWKRGYLNVGYFLASLDSNFRLGETNLGVGVGIDVEELLGLDTTDKSWRIDAGYRFGKTRRHKVELGWFKFDRTGTKFLDEQVEIPPELGGGTAGPGQVTSEFNFAIIKLKYEYSFVFDKRADLNLGIGVFVMPIEFGILGTVGGVGDAGVQEEITAPLPVVGLGFDFAITPKWIIRQQIDLFYLEIGDFSGGIADMNLALEWLPWKHFGFGLGLDSMRVHVEAEGSDYPGVDFKGKVEFNYFGAQLYVKAFF
jgi:hypothetical protein